MTPWATPRATNSWPRWRARLASAIRQEDTVGRLGGDEFVVLAEGASLDAGAEVVADRILDVMATPFEIAGSEAPLTVTASIGIAEGRRATPEDLLRDADIALYQAKAAGKRVLGGLRPRNARGRRRSPTSRSGSEHRSRVRPVLPAVPAGHRPGQWGLHRRRGAAALAASDQGGHPTRRLHPSSRVERAHRPRRTMGTRRGLPAGGDLGGARATASRSRSTSRPSSWIGTGSSTTSSGHCRRAASIRPCASWSSPRPP